MESPFDLNFLMIDDKIATTFPDGQKIVEIPQAFWDYYSDYGNKEHDICLGFRWSWENLQLLIGAVKVIRDNIDGDIMLYMPYMPGARADRAFGENQPSYFRDVIAPILKMLDFRFIYGMDAHSHVVSACLPNYVDIGNQWLVKKTISELPKNSGPQFTAGDCLVIPDAGASSKAGSISKYFASTVQCFKKRDPLTGQILGVKLAEELPEADRYIIVDDICDGGATFIALADLLHEHGIPRKKLMLVVTHGLFTKGFTKLSDKFGGIVFTNSVLAKEMVPVTSVVFDIWKPSFIQKRILNVWNQDI